MDSSPVVVAVVGSRVEAELAVGLLRSNGLKAGFSADDVGGQEPNMQLDGVHVLVGADDEAEARRILASVGN